MSASSTTRSIAVCSTSSPTRDVCGFSIPAAKSSRDAIFSTSTPTPRRRDFSSTLFTNGTLVTERIADHLVAWRPFAIEITLYGLTQATYERLTGIPGSFDKCMRGIRILIDRGLPLSLKTVAVSTNRHEIPAMQRFVEDELGVRVQVRLR